jgi:SAM-dependent methyltransferase
VHYPADLYELIHRGTTGDLAFYRRCCTDAKNVLELGCGYGRVLDALLDTGAQLTGLEHDRELLERARARLPDDVRLVEGDMTAFEVRGADGELERFDRIVIPHSAVYCLPDDSHCVACFRSARRHLAPHGRLVFDAYAADVFHRDEDPRDHTDERLDPIVTVELEELCYDVFERRRWDRPGQRLDVTYEYIPRSGGDARQGQLFHRYLLQDQIEGLLAQAGLALLTLEGDWRGGESRPDGSMWVATAGEPRPESDADAQADAHADPRVSR